MDCPGAAHDRLKRMGSFGAILVCALFGLGAKGCGGGGPDTSQPTINLLTPEELALAKHDLAVTGTTTGGVDHVEIIIDSMAPVVANGVGSFWYVLDVTAPPVGPLKDGAHTVKAKAVGNDASLYAETSPINFVSYAGAAAGTSFFYGTVRDENNQPVPGALVTTVENPASTTLSDSSGIYALTDLDPSRTYMLHAAATGKLDSYLPPVSASSISQVNVPLSTAVIRDYLAGLYGVTVQANTGWVLGFLYAGSQGLIGAQVTLSPPNPGGVHYFAANDFNPALTTTTAGGGFMAFNVAPGPVDFTATDGTAHFLTLGTQAAGSSVSFVLGFEQ